MKFHIPLISSCLLLQLCVSAQQTESAADTDPIAAAIESFNNRDRSQPDEGIAVFDHKPEPRTEPEPEPTKPILVTGKKPKNSELIDVSEIPVDPEAAELLPPSQPEAKGLSVHVQQIKAGNGNLKPESVRLLAPFPAKPLGEAPQGWLLKSTNNAPAFKRQVELAPGKNITLTIRPHLLVPDADQEHVLEVAEPGFEASLGYQQSDTVAAVLSDSIRKLDEDSKKIGNTIDQLQQLIVSLPKADPPAHPESEGVSSIPDAQNPIPK